MTSNPRSSASLFFSPTPTGDGGEVKIPHQPERLPADGGLSQAPPAVSRLNGAAPPRRRVPAAAAPFGPARLPSGLRQGEEGTRRPRRRCTSCGRPRWWRTCRGGGCGRPRRAGVANGGTSNSSRRATPSSAGASWAVPTTAAARSTPSTPPSTSII
ncbi:homeobox protein cut-like 1 isoform X1 [Triticum aestivum]|uniref:homeobox protein cut-like 1 isoform X1 n=1 Tax=Triticum aestivum TaxID=4565 RepID=UPI001D027B29|nr:homeobox protein cut-like 1 isoform X1 [Triticum aestivum]